MNKQETVWNRYVERFKETGNLQKVIAEMSDDPEVEKLGIFKDLGAHIVQMDEDAQELGSD